MCSQIPYRCNSVESFLESIHSVWLGKFTMIYVCVLLILLTLSGFSASPAAYRNEPLAKIMTDTDHPRNSQGITLFCVMLIFGNQLSILVADAIFIKEVTLKHAISNGSDLT